jgi:ABC-type nitrate/sulfonate/bicarbonate transport system substrate-binding protein
MPEAARPFTPLRFKLNHLVQGQNAPFLLAQQAGFFAREGIDVTFVEGFSSTQVTRALLAGEAEIGFGDVSSVLESALRLGTARVACLMPVFVRSPCALGYRRSEGPLRLADLHGAVLCGPDGDASARLLPLLLERNGLGHIRYTLHVVAPEERDRMIAQGIARAATCFDATLKFAMRMRGHDSSDLAFLYFAEHGLDTYSAALVALEAVLVAHPGLEAGLVRATRAAWEASRDDPGAAVAAALRHSPGLDAGILREQLDWVLRHNVFPGTRPPLAFLPTDERLAATLMVARHALDGGTTITPDMQRMAEAACRVSLGPDAAPGAAHAAPAAPAAPRQ